MGTLTETLEATFPSILSSVAPASTSPFALFFVSILQHVFISYVFPWFSDLLVSSLQNTRVTSFSSEALQQIDQAVSIELPDTFQVSKFSKESLAQLESRLCPDLSFHSPFTSVLPYSRLLFLLVSLQLSDREDDPTKISLPPSALPHAVYRVHAARRILYKLEGSTWMVFYHFDDDFDLPVKNVYFQIC